MAISNIKVQPMLMYIGKDQAQLQTITCVPAVALSGTYLLFTDAAGAKHYAWFNTGASTDPAPLGGWIAHSVSVLVTDAASAVATKLAAVLDIITGFDAVASGTVLTLTHTAFGYAQPARNGDGVLSPSFSYKVTKLGQIKKSAGCIKGDIAIKGFSQKKIDITCHASGTTVKDERITGYTKPEITFTLQETDKATLQDILVYYGMPVFTPVGTDQNSVFGYGPANVGGSNPKVLVTLHPVEKDASDKLGDWNFWSCELSIDTFNFSGENVSVIPATFSIFPDDAKPAGIQFFMIGDAIAAGY